MKTLHLLFLLTSIALTCLATEIRVRNDSRVDFTNVVAGEKKYGDIQQGATTDYQTWKRAYRYAFVSLLADSKLLKFQPQDYVGEIPLGDGRFTYVLTIQDGRLDIRGEKDPPDHSLHRAGASVEERWFP